MFLLTILGFMSCIKPDEFTTDSNAGVEFSLDTLTFDTVFTARGSATRLFKIYNPNDKFIRINRIWLEEGQESPFRLNVDGIPGSDLTDIEVPPNDSVYVFMEVTVDPDQPVSVSPFVIEDQVHFMTNGQMRSIQLEAWGQNANYVPDQFHNGKQALFTCDMNEWVWDDPKPYVIFGALVIDSCTLVMPPGTQVYIHGGLGKTPDGQPYSDGILYFFRDGKLQIEGSYDDPVVIQGDRLESSFDDQSGQWGRIQLGPLSRGHSINHAVIKNSIVGLLVDSMADLTIRNSEIYNASGSNLASYRGNVIAENCLFHTSGGVNVSITLGGSYRFSYCTLANYGSPSEALRATNFACLDGTPLCTIPVAARLRMDFKNSIIYGSSRDEISLVDGVGEQDPSFFQYSFENCLVRVDDLTDEDNHPDFFSHCDPCLNANSAEPLFVNPDENDYHLDSLSVAQEYAVPLSLIRRDLDGNDRDDNTPDAGCYEYVME